MPHPRLGSRGDVVGSDQGRTRAYGRVARSLPRALAPSDGPNGGSQTRAVRRQRLMQSSIKTGRVRKPSVTGSSRRTHEHNDALPLRMPAPRSWGTPMNTLEVNRCTQAWRDLGAALSRPRAAPSISAHSFINRTALTAVAQPRVIHDFNGFPPELVAFGDKPPTYCTTRCWSVCIKSQSETATNGSSEIWTYMFRLTK